MKRTVFGVLLMVLGMALLVTGTALFTVSAQSGQGTEEAFGTLEQENRVYAGEYYKNGDGTQEKVTVTDEEITFADGTASEYVLSVWKNIPETDEDSGKITYRDYCFLKLGDVKLSYDPLEKEVIIDGVAYKML